VAIDTGGHLQISGVLLKNLICGYFLNLKQLGIKAENDELYLSLFLIYSFTNIFYLPCFLAVVSLIVVLILEPDSHLNFTCTG
jgi:hypothetical protein